MDFVDVDNGSRHALKIKIDFSYLCITKYKNNLFYSNFNYVL